MNGGLLAVALTGGWMALNGELEPGDVAALTLMLMNVYQPLNILGWAYREIKQASVDLERLFQTLRLKPEVADKPDAPALALKGGSVRFEGVSFAHDGRARRRAPRDEEGDLRRDRPRARVADARVRAHDARLVRVDRAQVRAVAGSVCASTSS